MSEKITNCILLAAGFGTRLRPLTEKMPKPMIPFGNGRLIDFHLETLKKFSINNVVINLHYLGEQIEAYVGDGSKYGLKVQYSREPEILGTGGGVKQAASFLTSPSFVINTDTVHHCDLHELAQLHFKKQPAATLVVKKLRSTDTFSALALDEHSNIKSFRKTGEHFFTGIQIVTEKVLQMLPKAGTEACLIEQAYEPLLAQGEKIAAQVYEGYWNDLGTLESYQKAQADFKSGKI